MTQHREIAYRGLRLRKATEGDGRTIEGVAVPLRRHLQRPVGGRGDVRP